jgi:cytochrome c oxidase subunit I
MTGRFLSDRLGKWQFWLLFIGFNVTFFVQFYLGLDGMPRRIADYRISSWNDLNLVSTIGSFVMAVSMVIFLVNFVLSLRNGKPAGEDPWQGNSLEWVTSSPPPHHNFHELPEIRSERPAFDLRQRRRGQPDLAGRSDPQTTSRG